MKSPKVMPAAAMIAALSALAACGETDIELCNTAYDEGDYSSAMRYCQRSKAITSPDALYILGRIKSEGLGGIEVDRREGMDYLYRFLFVPGMNMSEYPYASDVLRQLTNDVSFMRKYPDKAAKLLKFFENLMKRPEFQNSQNYRALANLYINGLGTDPDYEKAWEYLDAASQKKDLDAMYYQSVMYINGMVEKTPEKAARFREILAKRSRSGVASVDELREYALSVINDGGDDTNIEYGLTVLRELATDNDGESAFVLGNLALEKKDVVTAKKWFRMAAEQGIPQASIRLSDLMYREKQYLNSFNLLSEAAASGSQLANFKIALIYLGKTSYGSDVPVDYDKGIDILQKMSAVSLDNRKKDSEYYALVAARRALASVYTYGGFNQPKDLKKAESLLLPLSEADADSAGELGNIYAMTEGELFDSTKALQMFEKSVTSGVTENNLIVGSMYLHGVGTKPDFEKAHRIFMRVADDGNNDAYNDLGNIFMNGLGVEKDIEKAEDFYTRAAANGNHVSLYNMSLLKASQSDYSGAYAWAAAYTSCGYGNAAQRVKGYFAKIDKTEQKQAVEKAVEIIGKYGCETPKNVKKWWLNPK